LAAAQMSAGFWDRAVDCADRVEPRRTWLIPPDSGLVQNLFCEPKVLRHKYRLLATKGDFSLGSNSIIQ
jgi:hypothetical protein